jgi:mRNA interferase MazF
MVTPIQGDVYWVQFGSPKDSGPAGKRPVVVIQNDLLNRSNIRTTVVALITSNLKLAAVPGNVRLKKRAANLPKPSVVVVSQIATIDISRLLKKMGTLDRENIVQIINNCQRIIRLSTV